MNVYWFEEELVIGPFALSGELHRCKPSAKLGDWLCGAEVDDPGAFESAQETLVKFVGAGTDVCLLVQGSPKRSQVTQLAERLNSPFLLALSRSALYVHADSFSNLREAGVHAYLGLTGQGMALWLGEAADQQVTIQDVDITELKWALVLAARNRIMAASGFDPMRAGRIEMLSAHVDRFVENGVSAEPVSWRFADKEISLAREDVREQLAAAGREYAAMVLRFMARRGITAVAVPARLDALLGLSDCARTYTGMRVHSISRADEVAGVLRLASLNAFEGIRDSVLIRSPSTASSQGQHANADAAPGDDDVLSDDPGGRELVAAKDGPSSQLIKGLLMLTLANSAAGAYLLSNQFGWVDGAAVSNRGTFAGEALTDLGKRTKTLEESLAGLWRAQAKEDTLPAGIDGLKDRVVGLETLAQQLGAETRVLSGRMDVKLPAIASQVDSFQTELGTLDDAINDVTMMSGGKRIVGLHEDGAPIVALGRNSNGGNLWIGNADAEARVGAYVEDDGGGTVYVRNKGGTDGVTLTTNEKGGRLWINNSDAETRVGAYVEDDGGGTVYVKNKGGKDGVTISTTESGGNVTIANGHGRDRVFLGPSSDGRFCIGILESDGTTFAKEAHFCAGGDVAEFVRPAPSEVLEPGTVVEIAGSDESGVLVRSASDFASTRVIGVVSGAGGLRPAITLNATGAAGEAPVTIGGTAFVKADTSGGPIQPGDLLVSSTKLGHASRIDRDHVPAGAVIGRAIDRLPDGMGLIRIWVGGG